MRQTKVWALAIIASVYGAVLFTSCSNEDNPMDNPEKSYDSILDEEKVWIIKKVGSTLERTGTQRGLEPLCIMAAS